MLAIRLTRMGAKKKPAYRVVVIDKRRARDSKSIEIVGHYNPTRDPIELSLKNDCIEYWLGQGAQLSDTVRRLMAYVPPPAEEKPAGGAGKKQEAKTAAEPPPPAEAAAAAEEAKPAAEEPPPGGAASAAGEGEAGGAQSESAGEGPAASAAANEKPSESS